jgi:MoaA/NifB/PqqE/SkfB family radical SAM enzyme
MISGKAELDSFPLNLGIDLYGRCNISPPCVYCLWHSMKEMEGDYAHVDVDEKTLESYGPFFRSARTLVNCSFGEPLLHPRFTEIVEFCDRHKKILEISSNGQAFTDRTISALAGKPIFLYISLDAATAETYAKIRNDRWEGIVPNLVRLNEARKKKGDLPKIFMVFMPMKVNRGDLREYFSLCRRIDADALVLRPLLYLWEPKIRIERGGYLFNYKDELLPREELEEIIAESERLSKEYNVPLANQFNFGLMEVQKENERKGPYFEFQRS